MKQYSVCLLDVSCVRESTGEPMESKYLLVSFRGEVDERAFLSAVGSGQLDELWGYKVRASHDDFGVDDADFEISGLREVSPQYDVGIAVQFVRREGFSLKGVAMDVVAALESFSGSDCIASRYIEDMREAASFRSYTESELLKEKTPGVVQGVPRGVSGL